MHATRKKKPTSQRKRGGKDVFWTGKTGPILISARVCGWGWGWGGCFMASDWLKKQGIKASHVLSIHYPRRKIHLGRDLAGRSLFSILFLHVRYKKNILSSERTAKKGKSSCLSLKSSVCNLAALCHQTIIPLGGTPFCRTPDA